MSGAPLIAWDRYEKPKGAISFHKCIHYKEIKVWSPGTLLSGCLIEGGPCFSKWLYPIYDYTPEPCVIGYARLSMKADSIFADVYLKSDLPIAGYLCIEMLAELSTKTVGRKRIKIGKLAEVVCLHIGASSQTRAKFINYVPKRK